MDFSGMVAVVTGAGRGHGREIALALGSAGCQLAVAARSADQLVAVANAVQAGGQQAIAVATDVTDESAVSVLVERARAVFGRIDILINAAAAGNRRSLIDTEPPEWHRLIGTGLSGAYLCTRAVVPIMRTQGGGSIVNLAGRRALRPDGSSTATATAQSGLLGMTRSLALELAAAAVRVNAICPGDDTTPADVAAAAVFLCGATSITGQAIEVQ